MKHFYRFLFFIFCFSPLLFVGFASFVGLNGFECLRWRMAVSNFLCVFFLDWRKENSFRFFDVSKNFIYYWKQTINSFSIGKCYTVIWTYFFKRACMNEWRFCNFVLFWGIFFEFNLFLLFFFLDTRSSRRFRQFSDPQWRSTTKNARSRQRRRRRSQ